LCATNLQGTDSSLTLNLPASASDSPGSPAGPPGRVTICHGHVGPPRRRHHCTVAPSEDPSHVLAGSTAPSSHGGKGRPGPAGPGAAMPSPPVMACQWPRVGLGRLPGARPRLPSPPARRLPDSRRGGCPAGPGNLNSDTVTARGAGPGHGCPLAGASGRLI
jgi:hypothetical protein